MKKNLSILLFWFSVVLLLATLSAEASYYCSIPWWLSWVIICPLFTYQIVFTAAKLHTKDVDWKDNKVTLSLIPLCLLCCYLYCRTCFELFF